MGNLDKVLAQAQKDIPDCVASGFVDMASGMLLGVKTVDSHPKEVLDLVAAATGDLFQGQNVTLIEKKFKGIRGSKDADDTHYFQEIIVLSTHLLHVFIRGKKNADHAAVFVCRKEANLGMVLTKARLAMTGIESSV